MKFELHLLVVLLYFVGFYPNLSSCFRPIITNYRKFTSNRCKEMESDKVDAQNTNDSELTSPEIVRLRNSIDSVYNQIATIQETITKESLALKEANDKYGPEIERLKQEFIDLKDRTNAEASKASEKAVCDAVKDILPITDNFLRLKQLYTPLLTEGEKKIFSAYSDVCDAFDKVIESFGITKVDSLGKFFDFNFMEAISTMESHEFPPNHVCMEYQIGYKMGDRCIRPSFVVVSTGPGPT